MKSKLLFLLLLATISFSSFSQITLLRDFAGTFSGNPAKGDPKNTIIFENKLYFNVEAADGLTRIYSSDGTTSGTSALKYGTGSNERFVSDTPNWKILDTPSSGGLQLGFIALDEVQKNNSNKEKHTYLSIINSTNNNLVEDYTENNLLEVIDNSFYFFKNNTNFHRLHRLDSEGNLTGSVQFQKSVKELFAFKNKLYISGASSLGIELYEYNPANNMNSLIVDLNQNGDSNPSNFIGMGDLLFFTANNGSGKKLFAFDTQSFQLNLVSNSEEAEAPFLFDRTGTPDGIVFTRTESGNKELAITVFNQASELISNLTLNNPKDLTAFKGYLYFTAENANSERELYRTDGFSPQNGELVFKINSNGSSNVKNLMEYNNRLYFSADDGVNGEELWAVDQNNNVSLVEDFISGSGSFSPIPLAVYDGKLYINGLKNTTERELFTYSDANLNTEDFTKLNVSIYPNPTSKKFTIKNNKNLKSLKLYSIKGKLLKEYKSVSSNLYDVSNLSKGIYLIKAETENSSYRTGKLIVK